MKFLVLLIVVVCCLTFNKADNLTVGNTNGATVAYLENVKLSSIPFTQRVKNVFYSDAINRNIRAITATDLGKTKGKATVTAGGVGASFVNMKIKGERGEALNYQVIIYV